MGSNILSLIAFVSGLASVPIQSLLHTSIAAAMHAPRDHFISQHHNSMHYGRLERQLAKSSSPLRYTFLGVRLRIPCASNIYMLKTMF